MVYNVLKRLESGGRLTDCSLSFFHPETINRKGFVYGRDIIAITRSRILFTGGESGREEFSMPLENVLEINAGGEIVFRKRKKIKRIHPRV